MISFAFLVLALLLNGNCHGFLQVSTRRHTQLWYQSPGSKTSGSDSISNDKNDELNVNHDLAALEVDVCGPTSSSSMQDDPVLNIPILEEKLKQLREKSADNVGGATPKSETDVENEQSIQKQLDEAKSMAELGVRAIQNDFYHAFSHGDLKQMDEVWSDEFNLSCIHPGMASIEGRKSIMKSWEEIFKFQADNADVNGKFRIQAGSGAKISICGMTAMCSCVEEIRYVPIDEDDDDDEEVMRRRGKQQVEALNVYKRENGSWRMTMHMANPSI
eukprot:CAMPEP_0119546470 /NCGR_PEP_ID=MMETSP1352-20130426/880_1 /TAXON_ID=265584 /ORGANISM="Stauroneis constricta, Strain CCMP1120" /LENGTH=273 /DNA_ID=CAMNT_0007591179 /DNA_START=75 /DNA_END=896 /DNA_ORIENTATION=-